MRNIDIIILNGLVILCFATFFVSTFRAFENKEKQTDTKIKQRGIISRFLAYLQSLVND
jgi:high-affinity nickel permease